MCRTETARLRAERPGSRRTGSPPTPTRRRYRSQRRSERPTSFPREDFPTGRRIGTDWADRWSAGHRRSFGTARWWRKRRRAPSRQTSRSATTSIDMRVPLDHSLVKRRVLHQDATRRTQLAICVTGYHLTERQRQSIVRHFYDHFSCRSPGLGVRECVTHLLERKDLVHERFDDASFH